MSESLKYRQIQKFSAKHPNEKLYRLETERELPFGYFYIGFDGEGIGVSTLIWQGMLQNPPSNQNLLDWEAFVSLPSHIDPHWTQNISFSPLDTRVVTFIIEARDLEEYDLNDSVQYNDYIRTIQNANMISFARYDVRKVSEPVSIEYSFTVENPLWSSNKGSELTILLPKTQLWTIQVTEWVLERQMAAKTLEIDPQNLFSILTMLTGFD